MDGCVNVFILIGVIAIVLVIWNANARERARKAYLESLAYLKNDPTNPNWRQEAVRLGRAYSNLSRNYRGVTVFDEVALMNDINAACAGASKPQAVLPAPKQPIAMRLAQLHDLRTAGLIDDSEYAERRRQILNEV